MVQNFISAFTLQGLQEVGDYQGVLLDVHKILWDSGSHKEYVL